MLMLGSTAFSQNLVSNAGFEQVSKCPPFWSEKQSDLTTTFWESPTTATPDNFTSCSKLSGVPQNWAGIMQAHSGEAYSGLIARRNYGRSTDDKRSSTHREYLQTKLTSTLEKGAEYKVTYYVALAENCRLASDEIGAYFSKSKPASSSKTRLPYTPQITNKNGVLKDTKTWMKIEGTFIATGTERYMTIGNFKSNSSAKFEEVSYPIRNQGKEFYFSYYFIDDVSVVKIGDSQAPVSSTSGSSSSGNATSTATPSTSGTTSSGAGTSNPSPASSNSTNSTSGNSGTTSSSGNTTSSNTTSTPAVVKSFKCECNICRTDVKAMLYDPIEPFEIDSSTYRVGQRVDLSGVTFLSNSAKLKLPDSQDDLDLLVFLLQEMPETEVELVIHMNALNNLSENKELSKETAATIYNYLRNNGVNNKILYNGFGQRIFPPDDDGASPDRTLELIIRKI